MIESGTVMESTGSRYKVLSDTGLVSECVLRGKLRLKAVRSTNPIAVGDRVETTCDESGERVITTIMPRKNYLIRRASNLSKESHIIASNIDRAVIVATLFAPETNLEFIDRCLVTCEAYHVPATIVLNKADMYVDYQEAVDHFVDVYASAGYRVIVASTITGEGMEDIKALLKDQTTLFTGNSGVGKSTLVNTIEPDREIRTGAISEAHLKGRHTTTFATMYPLRFGGRLIDTPGIKGFGLIDINPEELWHYFPEMLAYGAECRFYNCTHVHEPGCAVTEAVEQGKIAEERYVSYLKILDTDGKYR